MIPAWNGLLLVDQDGPVLSYMYSMSFFFSDSTWSLSLVSVTRRCSRKHWCYVPANQLLSRFPSQPPLSLASGGRLMESLCMNQDASKLTQVTIWHPSSLLKLRSRMLEPTHCTWTIHLARLHLMSRLLCWVSCLLGHVYINISF